MKDDRAEKSDIVMRNAAALSAALRAPLTDLFARISAISNRPEQLDSHTKAQLEAIQQDAYQMLRAVGSISMASSFRTEGMELAPINLWEELSQCMNAASVLLSSEGRTLEYQFPDTGEVVHGDAQALCTALLHLISNAFEASPKDGAVTISGNVLKDKAVITVSDYGCGIASQQLGRVFEPFYSLDHQGVPFQSLGLGLTLAQYVIERHGGSIRLLSDEVGTRVVCTLPLVNSEGQLPLHCDSRLYLEDRYSPVYVVLSGLVKAPWPYC